MSLKIKLINPSSGRALNTAANGSVLIDESGVNFPFINGAYRFVGNDNYTSNFGFQWNKFAKTQIDRFQANVAQSKDRFFAVTKWNDFDLSDQNVLEVGSGAGRFSHVVLNHTRANLFSVDYSNAVEANFRNNGPNERLNLFQASIYELPFEPNQFEKVFCFGVLQHTPDFKKSIKCLASMVKSGGELVVDFYPIKGWYTKIHSKYLLRPLFKNMTNEKLLHWIETNADLLISIYNFFERIGMGKIVNRFLPICDIKTTLPPNLSKAQLKEWVILDTFDMFSPKYDNPQRRSKVEQWFKDSGLKNVESKVVYYGEGNSVTFVRGIR